MTDKAAQNTYRRRNVLKYMAGGSMIALAGCAEQSDGSGNGNGDGGGDTRYDLIWGATDTPKNLTWNPYSQIRMKKIGEGLAHYNQAKSEWVGVLAKDWNFEQGKKFTVTLADAKWWNGDPVTADDAITTWTIDSVMTGGSSAVAGISKVDEKTFEFEIKGSINPNLLEETVLQWPIYLRKDLWKEEFNRAKESSGDSAVKKLKQEIVKRKIDEPYGNWIFKAKKGSTTGQKISYTLHDGHPNSEELNFSKLRWTVPTDGNQTALMMTSGKGDATNGAKSEQVKEEYKRNGVSTLTSGVPIGVGLAMNQKKRKEFRDRRVRKAIAYITKPKQVEKVSSGKAAAGHVTPPTGMAGSMAVGSYIPDEMMSSFTSYKPDTKKAKSLLEEVGFSGGKDGWKTPDGEDFTLEILTGGPWDDGGKVVESSLNEFGINTKTRNVQDYFTKRNTSDWDLSMQPWGSWKYFFHPIGAYQGDLLATIYPPDEVNGWKKFITPREATESGKITVPWPVGKPSGNEKTVNVQGKIETLLTTTDKNEEKKLLQELAWVYNQTLTIRPLTVNVASYFVNTDRFKVPSEEEWQMQASFHKFLSHGLIQAKKS